MSLVLIFLLALASEWLAARQRRSRHGPIGVSPSSASPQRLHVFFTHMTTISIGYALMLLTMTFNAGVCVAVVAGLALGRTSFSAS